MHGVTQLKNPAHHGIGRGHHKEMPCPFLLTIPHPHHIQRHVVHMRVEHLTNLITGRRTQFFRRHRWRVDLQQLVLLRPQHNASLQTLQPQTLQATNKVFRAISTLMFHAQLEYLMRSVGACAREHISQRLARPGHHQLLTRTLTPPGPAHGQRISGERGKAMLGEISVMKDTMCRSGLL